MSAWASQAPPPAAPHGQGASAPSGRVPPSPSLAEPPRGAIPDFVESTLADLRLGNALVITWLHVAARAAIVVVVAWMAATTTSPFYPTAVRVNGAFLAATAVVLLALWRRWGTSWAIRALLLLDLASLAVGGWRFAHLMPPVEAAWGLVVIVSLTQVVLLCGALVLAERDLVALGALALLLTASWGALGHVSRPFLHLLLVAVAFTSAVVIWAARRIVRLAIQGSVEAYTARVLRAHRDELDAANRQTRESQAHAERLTQLIVHDLKNPLTVLLTHLSLVHWKIERLPGLAQETQDLQIAHDEGTRLADMIGDILLVSRLEKGELMLRLTCVGIREVVSAASRALEPVSAAREVRLEVDPGPDVVAPLDVALIRRLIENLVVNAIRHAGPGDRIQIAAGCDAQALRLAVRNTGPAIDQAVRAHLFEKGADRGPGEWHNVGLGLRACRLVAEAHGGSIALVDRAGWNVSFEVTLPLGTCTIGADDSRSPTCFREADIRRCPRPRQGSGR